MPVSWWHKHSSYAYAWKHPKTGTYYFRRAVPADLRYKLGWEVKGSPDPTSPAEAKRLLVAEPEKSE